MFRVGRPVHRPGLQPAIAYSNEDTRAVLRRDALHRMLRARTRITKALQVAGGFNGRQKLVCSIEGEKRNRGNRGLGRSGDGCDCDPKIFSTKSWMVKLLCLREHGEEIEKMTARAPTSLCNE